MAIGPTSRHHPRPYWRNTRLQMLMCLLMPCVALPFMPHILTKLSGRTFLGFPLGYFLAMHGFIIFGCFVVSWFVRRQDRIDRWHGTHEDF
jgi:putative solute:sodium symporter small subunit